MHFKIIATFILAIISSTAIAAPLPWDGGNAYTGAAGDAAGGAANAQSPADAGTLNVVQPTSDYGLFGLGSLGNGFLAGDSRGGDGGRAVSGNAKGGNGGDRLTAAGAQNSEGGSAGGDAFSGAGGNTAGGGDNGYGAGLYNIFGGSGGGNGGDSDSGSATGGGAGDEIAE